MAAHVHSDENNVIQLIYDTPDDIMSIINYPHFDAQGIPELQLKTVEVKRLNFE